MPRVAIFVVPMILVLILAQRAAPHVRAVDFLLVFGSGVLFGISLLRLIQILRAGGPSER